MDVWAGVLISVVGIVVPFTTLILKFIQDRTIAREARADAMEARGASAAATRASLEAAKKVEAVRVDLQGSQQRTANTLAGLVKVSHDTHVLVNNNMAIQLKLAAELSEFKAATTNKPEDIQAALYARTLYQEHLNKQALVDGGLNLP